MPGYKLTIEYSDDKPFFPYDHVRIEAKHNAQVIYKGLRDYLELGTDTNIIIPLDAQGNPIKDIPILNRYTKRKPSGGR